MTISNNIVRYFIVLFVFSLCFAYSGCSGSSGDYDSFLSGDGKILYYIKPVSFDSDSPYSLIIDITFKASASDTAICNFSVRSDDDQPLRISNAKFVCDSKNDINLFSINRLFKQGELSRFTGKTKYTDFKSLFSARKINFLIQLENNSELKFEASGDFYKVLSKLSNDVE